LYHEATFIENDSERAKATFHSTAAQAAKIATQANVHKLLLGHLSARYEKPDAHLAESSAIFPNSEVVEDGRSYPISK
jgi:ribonuclease Z